MKTIDFAEGNFEILAKIEKALEPLRKQTAYMGRITSNFKCRRRGRIFGLDIENQCREMKMFQEVQT